MSYESSSEDEVEDLYELLLEIKTKHHPEIQGVSVGAIVSNYQRLRVENVCSRLGMNYNCVLLLIHLCYTLPTSITRPNPVELPLATR